MKGIRSKITVAVSLMLTILFIYTATSKFMHLGLFELRLERMPYIALYAKALSWGIPFLELVIVGLLLLPKSRMRGLYASLVLLTLFTGYIIIVLQFSEHIPCSCGGVLSALRWDDHIVFNSICMALSLMAIVLSKKHNKKSNG